MKAQDIIDLLEKECFYNNKWDINDNGWGTAVYVRNDGEELVGVEVSVEPAEN